MAEIVMPAIIAGAVLVVLIAIAAPLLASRIRRRHARLVDAELARVADAVTAWSNATGHAPNGVASVVDGVLELDGLRVEVDPRVVVDLVGDGFDVLVTAWHRSAPWRPTDWSTTIGVRATP